MKGNEPTSLALKTSCRRGVAAIVVLVLLTVVAGLTASCLQVSLRARRSAISYGKRVQADLLAESGLRLASASEAASGGEFVWRLDDGELKGSAEVTIKPAGSKGATATARFPLSDTHPAKSTSPMLGSDSNSSVDSADTK
ncbi:hypothetical protein Pan189_05320 [Stratiformator vulcanicus]|uniref:Uncharacterized protein n=1 Tax=Stratiformator vulcanicus TaxID=2527980 RepID=A0A517QX54_9PLAN|nr:hypothetical protein Pan189_05320 [Stratiformator vulcanicus]